MTSRQEGVDEAPIGSDPLSLLASMRTRIVFATIMFVATAAQVLLTPVSVVLEGIDWPLAIDVATAVTLLTLGCAAQAAMLIVSPRFPSLAVVGSLAMYIALLFLTSAPAWLTAMHLVVALTLFLLAAHSSTLVSVLWAVLLAGAMAIGWLLWTLTVTTDLAGFVTFIVSSTIPFALLLWAAAALGIGWRIVVARAERARTAAEAAQQEHDDRVAQATAAERARIGQELHDVAGQHLAGLITLADAAITIAPEHPDDALRLVQDVRAEGRFAAASLSGALQDLRAVDTERVEVTKDLRRLPDLVAFWQQRGMSIATRSSGSFDDLPAVISTTGYRAVSEAFTNAAKYAPGAQVELSSAFDAEALEIIVRNGPRTSSDATDRGIGLGWGLATLRDRVELLRGTMTAGPTPDEGWRLAVRMPVSVDHP